MDKFLIREKIKTIRLSLAELEEALEIREFHCYCCKTDKPMQEQSKITSAMCWQCAAATNPRLHPELLKNEHPHLYKKYMSELEEYQKEYAQQIGRSVEQLLAK